MTVMTAIMITTATVITTGTPRPTDGHPDHHLARAVTGQPARQCRLSVDVARSRRHVRTSAIPRHPARIGLAEEIGEITSVTAVIGALVVVIEGAAVVAGERRGAG